MLINDKITFSRCIDKCISQMKPLQNKENDGANSLPTWICDETIDKHLCTYCVWKRFIILFRLQEELNTVFSL